MAAQASREALAAGVHVTYSPVADVDRNPANPIIGARAYGPDPERAARLVAAFVAGVHDAGQIATAKHFPGHGGTDEDSHATTPTVTDSRDVLEATDLVPFRAAVAAGVDAIMTAHIAVPALDPSGQIATRSAPILRGLLRDELGFEGVVVTDSLQMAGAKEAGPDGGRPRGRPARRRRGPLRRRRRSGGTHRGPRPRGRGGAAGRGAPRRRPRARAAPPRPPARRASARASSATPGLTYPPSVVAAPEHQALSERVARAALDVVRGPLPTDLGDGAGVLFVGFRRPPLPIEPPAMALEAAVREHFPAATYRELLPAPHTPDADVDEVLARAAGMRRVVLAPVIRPSAWHAFGLAPREQALADALADAAPTTLLLLGDRRGLAGFPRADSALVAHSDVPASQRALVARLKG